MRAVLLDWQHGAGAEHANDARYFERIWDRSKARERDEPPDDDFVWGDWTQAEADYHRALAWSRERNAK